MVLPNTVGMDRMGGRNMGHGCPSDTEYYPFTVPTPYTTEGTSEERVTYMCGLNVRHDSVFLCDVAACLVFSLSWVNDVLVAVVAWWGSCCQIAMAVVMTWPWVWYACVTGKFGTCWTCSGCGGRVIVCGWPNVVALSIRLQKLSLAKWRECCGQHLCRPFDMGW